MKHPVGQWVEVTAHREGAPDLVLRGRIVEATSDYALAECRTPSGTVRFVYDAGSAGHLYFRNLTGRDWARSRRR